MGDWTSEIEYTYRGETYSITLSGSEEDSVPTGYILAMRIENPPGSSPVIDCAQERWVNAEEAIEQAKLAARSHADATSAQ